MTTLQLSSRPSTSDSGQIDIRSRGEPTQRSATSRMPSDRPNLPPLFLKTSPLSGSAELRKSRYSQKYERTLNNQLMTFRDVLDSTPASTSISQRNIASLPPGIGSLKSDEEDLETMLVTQRLMEEVNFMLHPSTGGGFGWKTARAAQKIRSTPKVKRVLSTDRAQTSFDFVRPKSGFSNEWLDERDLEGQEQRRKKKQKVVRKTQTGLTDEEIADMRAEITKAREKRGKKPTIQKEGVFLTEAWSNSTVMVHLREVQEEDGILMSKRQPAMTERQPGMTERPGTTERAASSLTTRTFVNTPYAQSRQRSAMDTTRTQTTLSNKNTTRMIRARHRKAELDQKDDLERRRLGRILQQRQRQESGSTRGQYIVTARQKEVGRQWGVLTALLARVAVLSDGLQENRARGDICRRIVSVKRKAQADKEFERNEKIVDSWRRHVPIVMRLLNGVVVMRGAAERGEGSQIIRRVLFEMFLQNSFTTKATLYRMKIIRLQRMFRSFLVCRKAQIKALDLMWHAEEGILCFGDAPRDVSAARYPQFMIKTETEEKPRDFEAERAELRERYKEVGVIRRWIEGKSRRESVFLSPQAVRPDEPEKEKKQTFENPFDLPLDNPSDPAIQHIVSSFLALNDRQMKRKKTIVKSSHGSTRVSLGSTRTALGSTLRIAAPRSASGANTSRLGTTRTLEELEREESRAAEKERQQDHIRSLLLSSVAPKRKPVATKAAATETTRPFLIPEALRHPTLVRHASALLTLHLLRTVRVRGEAEKVGVEVNRLREEQEKAREARKRERQARQERREEIERIALDNARAEDKGSKNGKNRTRSRVQVEEDEQAVYERHAFRLFTQMRVLMRGLVLEAMIKRILQQRASES
ncbi:hypothetical protein BLNAU_8620 [Blattamonas nauphoetae]|uniref:Uncharacterized protein n=1 Tax=Blattamonas nauphoetae TaxID=2049346 RepID=A0ABQ9XY16_9EUKA|nr:hypothetical protein BLNAU_8620 [Blattamonas nauphoetae]